MEYMFETEAKSGHNGGAHEADKKAVDVARGIAKTKNVPCTVWRKVATVTPVTTTEVTMHTGDGK